MCRNIRALFNFEPPASDEEIQLAAVQFVRKVSGFSKPSAANAPACEAATAEIGAAVRRLLQSLATDAPTKDRVTEAAKGRSRAMKRYGAA